MSNVADVKPWFREDLARTLMSIYFASVQGNGQSAQYRAGFAAALSSVALAVGVNPEAFLKPEDVQLLKSNI